MFEDLVSQCSNGFMWSRMAVSPIVKMLPKMVMRYVRGGGLCSAHNRAIPIIRRLICRQLPGECCESDVTSATFKNRVYSTIEQGRMIRG